MSKIVFRPHHGDDREERLESQALQEALETALPGQVLVDDVVPADTTHFFGRMPRWARMPPVAYPAREHTHVPYWEWDGFLQNAERGFWMLPYEDAKAKVAELHDAGKDAFVKSTRTKHFVASVPRGVTLEHELGDMVYSFIDGGPDLMVQEFVTIRQEYRIFVVDGVAVTGSGKVMHHTPYHNPGYAFTTFLPEPDSGLLSGLYRARAAEIIPTLPCKSCAIDFGLINGRPGIVEINPLHLGQCGLFACDVDRLVEAVLASCGLNPSVAAA